MEEVKIVLDDAYKAKIISAGEAEARAAERYLAESNRKRELRHLAAELTKECRRNAPYEALMQSFIRIKFGSLKTIAFKVIHVISFIIAFLITVGLSTTQLLRLHGPTVTNFGTFAAFFLHLGVGVAVGIAASLLVHRLLDDAYQENLKRINDVEEKITKLTSEQSADTIRKQTGIK